MLSQFSVKKPYTVFVGVILIIVLGVISFTGMSTDLLPNIELPYIIVVTSYPGASPEQVEQSVTRPLESSLATAGGLKNLRSVSAENSSTIILEFAQDINMDSVMIELSNLLDLVSARLDESVGKPILLQLNPDMMPIMVTTVDVQGKDIAEISKFVTDEIIPSFERIVGVASVSAVGLLEKELQVALNQEKIDNLNEKVTNGLEDTLNDKRKQLEDAQAEIVKARSNLDAEHLSQQDKLAQSGVKLDNAIANLNALLAEETMLNTQRTAFEKEKESLVQLVPLNTLFAQVFPNGADILTPQMYNTIMEQLAPRLPEPFANITQDQMGSLIKLSAGASARIASIDTELQNIGVQLAAINAMTPKLEDGLAEATAGYQKVEEGKMTLAIEMSRLKMQLENSAAELEKGLAELDRNKENAIKRSDLNRIINAEMVSNLLRAQNLTMPVGYIQDSENGQLVKVVGRFESEESLENTVIMSLDGIGDIRLVDVADVAVTDNAAQIYTKVNGNDSVVLTFQKQSTASTADVSNRINDMIEDLTERYKELTIMTLLDQGDYIDMSISSVLQNLLIGGVLAIFVLILFLKDFRPTLVIAFSIPISLMFAVTLMYFSDVSLNIISLSGLALGVGMLVDNSIVVMENIYRLRSQGLAIYKAAVIGTRQVSGAIFASTLTTVCVFLPIVFTEGLSRQLFTDMGLTIAYSLLASLLVAVTLVPAMSSSVLKNTRGESLKWFDFLVRMYEKALKFSLNHKVLVMALVTVLFVLSIYGATVMGTSFMPDVDSPQMRATLTVPEGSSREELHAISDVVMSRVLEIEAVQSVGAMAETFGGMRMMTGISSGRRSTGETTFFILLHEERTLTNREVERLIIEKTKDLDVEISVSASNMNIAALGESGIQLVVKGRDLDVLAETAQEVAEILRAIAGTVDVLSGTEDAGKETRIIVDKDAAVREGLTVAQVYQLIRDAVTDEARSTSLIGETEEYPVVIVKADHNVITAENIESYKLTFNTRDGEERTVPLSQLAQLIEAQSPHEINRIDQSRQITVSASIADGYNIGLVSREFENLLADFTSHEGVTLEMAGEDEMIEASMQDVILMIALAVVFIYLIMVAQFQSLLSPVIILFTMPLAFTGGLLLLWISGMELSVVAVLGFLVLAGIVVNNGIVFVDFTNQLRLEGMDKRRAILETGVARIRPILMTALTTILAMSTIAIGIGRGAEMTQPMAVVTIGGLTYATFMTLFVVPVMYDALHRRPMKKIDIGDDEVSLV